MQNKTTRVLIETFVRKALRDIRDNPDRTIRNLVDMAQQFSKGRFQQHFFAAAQTMLQNENSPYYGLVQDVVNHVEHDRLMTFGMNIGYNGCNQGAKIIRVTEAAEGYNIPWAITLHMPEQITDVQLKDYQHLIDQGEKLGVHVWFMFCTAEPEALLPIVAAHPDSAFSLFLEPELVTERFLDEASEHNHLLLSIHNHEEAADLFAVLRERKLLYAAHAFYDEANADEILTGDMVQTMQQDAPVSVLIDAPGCGSDTQQRVHAYVDQARADQLYRTLLWEFTLDNRFVDTVISGDACSAGFTSEGYLYTLQEVWDEPEMSFHHGSLPGILRRAFPKEGT